MLIGSTGDDIYPINSLFAYSSRRGNKPGLLFQWQESSPLTKSEVVSKVRSALLAANLLMSDFVDHSFRIGAATTAATVGLDDSTRQMLV